MAKRIFLIGYMASGKSWVGQELAPLTGLTFIDLDDLFEKTYRISILGFFEKYGESLFRQLETTMLLTTFQRENVVVATGGGTPCFHGNMDGILRHGQAIYLRMPVPDLVERIRLIRKKRPLLKDVLSQNLEQIIRSQLEVREPFYARASYSFQGPDYPVTRMACLINGLPG